MNTTEALAQLEKSRWAAQYQKERAVTETTEQFYEGVISGLDEAIRTLQQLQ